MPRQVEAAYDICNDPMLRLEIDDDFRVGALTGLTKANSHQLPESSSRPKPNLPGYSDVEMKLDEGMTDAEVLEQRLVSQRYP